jgi:uncharacterized repeat protein (TIGR01451 family)
MVQRVLASFFVILGAPIVLAQSADLSVTLTMPATVFYSSGASAADATGQFTVTNAGPSIAQNVTIDFGPNTSVSLPGTGFSCGVTNGHAVCTTISMAPGSLSHSFFVHWPFAANGTVETTTVTVSSGSPTDPNAANNSASQTTTVVWQADLQLFNVGIPSGAPGALVGLTAFYSNHGPSPATDFKLTISIPPGALYYDYYADDWLHCTEPPKGGQGDLVCTGSNVGTFEGFDVEADVRIDPAATPGTVLKFPVTLTSTDAIHPSQTQSPTLTVVAPANLHAEISAPASAPSGSTFQTTITFTNQGPANATNAAVSYSQTGGGQYGPIAGPPGWSCTDASCRISSFPPGTATFTIPTSIPPQVQSGTLAARVIASADNDPNDAEIVRASTAIIAPPPATLGLTMTAAPAIVYTGDQLTYTAAIANTSNAEAQNVQLLWSVPGTVVATTCGAISDPVCKFATIAAGATQTVTRTVRVDAGAGTRLTAQATVSATNVAQPASATVTTTVAGAPHVDLGVTIFAPASMRAGTTQTWTYSIGNSGPDTATDWQLSLTLPPNTTLAGWPIDAFQGNCSGLTPNAANAQITCNGTYLTSGSHTDINLYLMVTAGTTAPIHATASVSTTANVDPNPQNNTAAVDTSIITSAQLSASLTTDKTAAVFGERVTQTLTITNGGPDTATGIIVNFTIPGVLATMSSTFASCTATPPIRCSAPSLANGATLTATFSFIAPAKAGLWGTDADVFWDNAATGSGFTSAGFTLQVVAPPPASDVTIALEAAPSTLATGDSVTYTVAATNLGGAAASNVMVEFDVPSALAFVSASPECSGGAHVTCTAGTLNSGASATFTVTARAVVTGTITAQASVSTSSEESNNGNNTAAATIVVSTPAPPARRRAARH